MRDNVRIKLGDLLGCADIVPIIDVNMSIEIYVRGDEDYELLCKTSVFDADKDVDEHFMDAWIKGITANQDTLFIYLG